MTMTGRVRCLRSKAKREPEVSEAMTDTRASDPLAAEVARLREALRLAQLSSDHPETKARRIAEIESRLAETEKALGGSRER